MPRERLLEILPGNIKDNEQPIVTGNNKYKGWMQSLVASAARIGVNSAVVPVLENTCVNRQANIVTMNAIAGGDRPEF